ncbi:MAG: hypothetical protein DHS20C14_13950 [Phycisphaeraceae bacterium]|nr:MAG: hypothetical protein DHS20C14_13950 [Phycisphaeraceae bacterium]
MVQLFAIAALDRDRSGCGPARGFSLVEIMVVVIVIGIIAAAVIPRYGTSVREARAAAIVQQLKVIDGVAATNGTPETLEVTWFRGNSFPPHPENDLGINAIESVSAAGTEHPTNKVLVAGVAGAFWYNSAEGIVRARVADQGSSSATLEHYNAVNASSETALGNYGGGGGGGGGS